MKVAYARSKASEWVIQIASREPEYMGAYYSGSTIRMTDDMEMPAASDIDIVIVTKHDVPPLKLGKFIYRGVLIEVTYLSWGQLATVEDVLASYHLAGSFQVDTIIADPTGHLRSLYSQVSSHFKEMEWVRRRCENARERIENGLHAIDSSAPFHDQVTAWLFPASVTTHVLLVAALRNPTVRLRYLAVREVLIKYKQTNLYEELLELVGCSKLSPQLVEHHLNELARTFDAAAAISKTLFFFSTDITAAARPIAIDGSRELIRAGFHREAVFWIIATFARSHKILAADAPIEVQNAYIPAFKAAVADLGISSSSDLTRRARDVIEFLPRLWSATEEILQANPEIVIK
ncbi:hypothetical protein FHS15_000619 [Paenibacillus castaneae]|uniref:hypothetical protein n=1 Tax=Paenibacillus castaneae TaxID=474957 RepID=UPI000C9A89AA|nr:hypothetical protein [Paenibacillus castaneae]NIK75519.1 hypothetical protein [Paenibacillus castaneae]